MIAHTRQCMSNFEGFVILKFAAIILLPIAILYKSGSFSVFHRKTEKERINDCNEDAMKNNCPAHSIPSYQAIIFINLFLLFVAHQWATNLQVSILRWHRTCKQTQY